MISNLNEDDYRHSENALIFQQDGSPPHYAEPVRQYLNATFPGMWIERRFDIEYPPRSPYLAPLDFILWSHLKPLIYLIQLNSLQDLRDRFNISH